MPGGENGFARHLVVCCDGTWQTSMMDSNVARLHRALADVDGRGRHQLATYVRGVGTAGSLWHRLTGGLAGVGLSHTVLEAYRWLARHYRTGDRITLFGFSRGAYTARSLAGMIGSCGLLDAAGVPEDVLSDLVERVHRRYRERDRDPADERWRAGLRFGYDAREPGIPIHLIGVWDTVGALGIPDHLGLLTLLDLRERFEFHDVRLDPRIPHGRHAVALDEMRGPFRPTLWQDPAPDQDVRQLWFPGDHLDVGGGHLTHDLSDGALRWMIDEAAAVAGLAFDPATVDSFRPDPLGVLHPRATLLRPVVDPVLEVALQPRPRAVPRVGPGAPDVHESAVARQRATDLPTGPYRPTRTPAIGEPLAVEVPADEGWFPTGLFLEPGEYEFAAAGSWRSLAQTAGPQGRDRLPLGLGALVGPVLDRGEAVYRRLVRDPQAIVVGGRREPDLPWLSLVAVVADEERDAHGRVRHPDERIPVGRGNSARVRRAGYLFAYANDAWGGYLDNAGALRMTVTRRS